MRNIWSGKRHRYATYAGMAKAMERRLEQLERSKLIGQPEPGIFQSNWPIPRAKVINTWAEAPSPVLGLPFVRYDLEVEGLGIVAFRRFVAPIQGYDVPDEPTDDT